MPSIGNSIDDRFPDDSRAFQTPAFSPKWTMRGGAQYSFDLGNARARSRLAAKPATSAAPHLAVDNTFILYPPAPGVDGGLAPTIEVDGLFQKAYWMHDARIV